MITVPEKSLFFVLPYLGPLSLQTNNLTKSLKGILKCWKLQVGFKGLNKFSNPFRVKYRFPKIFAILELQIRVTKPSYAKRSHTSSY